MLGAYHLGGSYLQRTRTLVDSLPILPSGRAAYHEAGRLGAELLSRRSPLGQADPFVAAITSRHGQRLLTRDRTSTRVPRLVVETY